MAPIELTVNGVTHRLEVDPDRSVLEVLRERLGLFGTKYGCGEAQCGACTVWLDGRAVRACVARVGALEGRGVTTIEGLAGESPTGGGRVGEGTTGAEALHPVQEAFLAEDAMQCGYCTPGMIMSAAALLDRNPTPSDDEILEALEGNLCRCAVHLPILAAVRRASGMLASGDRP